MNDWSRLAANDQEAVDVLIQRLAARPDLGVTDLYLFGSKSRGDATLDSDIDIAVLVDDETGPVRDTIWTLGARVSLEYDVLFNLYVIGRERWQAMKAMDYPLARNIEREGIRLAPESEGAPHAGMRSPADAAHLA